jgi:hypothetical protein
MERLERVGTVGLKMKTDAYADRIYEEAPGVFERIAEDYS